MTKWNASFCVPAWIALALLTAAADAGAQSTAVITPPPNSVVSNDNGVPAGPYGGLEGPAFGARVSDPSAAWFNPAGLSRADGAQISGSAGVYELTTVSPQSLPNAGGSAQQLPSMVGFTVKANPHLTLGFALLTTNSWLQETDAQLVTLSAATQERFAYSADSEYTRRVAALSAGYSNGGPWRFGAGLAISLADLRLVQSVGDRVNDGSTLRSLLVTSRTSGSAVQVRSIFGTQYDGISHMRIGATVRTPALTVFRTGVVTLDSVLDNGPSSLGASVFDADATFQSHFPWEIQAGAAYIGTRGELEFDVQGYTPVSAYSMLASPKPLVLYTDPGTGAPPTVTTQPFNGLTSASRGFANVSVGGDVKLFADRTWRAHFGLASDLSPVAPEDQVFTTVDLISWTLGLSGSIKKFSFSAGVHGRSGTANDVVVRNLVSGQSIHTSSDIRTIGFIYSVSYQF